MLQSASRKELTRIAIGTAVMTVLMLAVFFVLGMLNVVTFGFPIIVSALGGAAVAVANFYGLCIAVQKATACDEPKRARAVMQSSYQLRMIFQAVWGIIALAVPYLNPFAAIIPLLFPRIVIMAVQIASRKSASVPSNTQQETQSEEKDEMQ